MLRVGILGALLAACTGEPPDDLVPEPMECTGSGRYLPLAPGASWSYAVTGGKRKTQAVGELEDVGGAKAGTLAFRITTTKTNGETISWQEDTGTSVVRHREQDRSGMTHTDEVYTPRQTRIDEADAHLVVGVTWTETYDELVSKPDQPMIRVPKTDTWLVVSDGEAVDVPAGSFCTLHLQRTTKVGSNPPKTKHFWFARGVGKVREKDDQGDVEELSGFTTP